MSSVYLVYSPTRTRDYTGTLLDISSDMFVPCTKLDAVCGTPEAARAVYNRAMERLRDDAPPPPGIQYHLTLETGLPPKLLPKLWAGAVRLLDRELEGKASDEPGPATVWVVHRTRLTYAWDGSEHTTLEPIGVFATEEAAKAAVSPYLDRIQVTMESGGSLSGAMRELGLPIGDFIDFAEFPLVGAHVSAER
jgi:hypothetical protein